MGGKGFKVDDVATRAKAAVMWRAFDNNEKVGVRFGLFPAKKMEEATMDGFDGHQLCVELMNCAQQDGGMAG